MTREEAIKMIQGHEYPNPTEAWQMINNEAIDMAISALHFEADCRSCMWREKYEEQTEPSGKENNSADSSLTYSAEADKESECKLDLISRADAIRTVGNNVYAFTPTQMDIKHHCIEQIKEVPSVSAERVNKGGGAE